MKINYAVAKQVAEIEQDMRNKVTSKGSMLFQELSKDIDEIAKQYFVENGYKIIYDVITGKIPITGQFRNGENKHSTFQLVINTPSVVKQMEKRWVSFDAELKRITSEITTEEQKKIQAIYKKASKSSKGRK